MKFQFLPLRPLTSVINGYDWPVMARMQCPAGYQSDRDGTASSLLEGLMLRIA